MKIKYENIPSWWQLCFLQDCGRKTQCLRHLAGKSIPDTLLSAPSVTPAVLKHAECPMFREVEVVRAAVGFSRIFSEVKQRHAPEMREKLSRYLGGNGTYYRYLHGIRTLMPEQQQWIRTLFANYGYGDEVEFDDYQEEVRFQNV